MSIVLYGEKFWMSPYVYSCFVALKEKQLPFEMKIISLGGGEHKKAEMAKAITARVPALNHDGFWLAESSAIVEYFDDAFPQTARALPTGVKERARARQIMAWIRSDLMALREERPTSSIFFADQRAKTPFTKAGREAADKLLRVAGELVRDAKSPIFEAFSVVDADLALMLQRLVANGEDAPPRLRDWANAQWSRPSVKAFVDHERPAYEPY